MQSRSWSSPNLKASAAVMSPVPDPHQLHFKEGKWMPKESSPKVDLLRPWYKWYHVSRSCLSRKYFASRHTRWVCALLLGEIFLTNSACDLQLKTPCLKRNSIKCPGFGISPSFSWINIFISKPYKACFLLGFSTGVFWAVMVITVTMATLIWPE